MTLRSVMQITFPSLSARVLVIEDEPDLREAMVSYLRMDQMVAIGAGGLLEAERLLVVHDFDVLVLDLGLPDGDGLAWLASHPALGSKGVVITTARGEACARISGVRAGADVYLVKPVQLEELAALICNLWRRLRPMASKAWVLDATSWSLLAPEGAAIKLTHSEQVLLIELARVPGQSVTRDELALALGHDPNVYDPRRMEILVRRLRNKAKELLGYELPLETAHRQGYAFTAPILVNRSAVGSTEQVGPG